METILNIEEWLGLKRGIEFAVTFIAWNNILIKSYQIDLWGLFFHIASSIVASMIIFLLLVALMYHILYKFPA